MADNFTLPAVAEVVRATEHADGSKSQHNMQGIFESTANTSTTPLGTSATFTGTGEIAPDDGVTVSCTTDNSGTLYLDFSPDGTNWGAFPPAGVPVIANIHRYISAKVNGRYFRARLVNDAGAQTYLRLYSYFGPNSLPNAPIGFGVDDNSSAVTVKSVGTGKDPTDNYTNNRNDGIVFSTTANLAGSATYDSDIISVDGYTQAKTEVLSNTDGTITVTSYSDSGGTDTIRTLNVPYTAAGGFVTIASLTFGPYTRWSFTNGSGSSQTDFFFSTNLITKSLNGQLVNLTSALADGMIANVGRNILVGQDTDGDFQNISCNTGGQLYVADSMWEIAKGNVTGSALVEIQGENPDVDTGAAEDIWAGGGAYTGQPVSTSETVNVFSSSTADTSAGTGARTIEIYGLDASYLLQNETITMNGTTAVTSIGTYRRVFKVEVLTAGTGAENAGTITVRHTTTTANVFSVQALGTNKSTIGAYTIPAGKTGYLIMADMAAGTNTTSNLAIASLRVRKTGGVYQKEISFLLSLGNQQKAERIVTLPAQTDIKFRCSSVTDNNTNVSASARIVLVDD